MNHTMIRRLCSLVFALSLLLFLLTASIGLPIYIRPFYYAHIDAMNLPEMSGFTKEQIVEAYDEVLDYLTLPGREFGTGALKYSESGKDHFVDCKVLFDLNGSVLLGSGILLAVLLLLKKKLGPYRLGNRSAAFYGALIALILPIVLGGLAALDFDRAFVIFHSIFFPGKTNWLFDYRTDEIIRVLPQDFFMHCAMLIGGGLLVFSGSILLADRIRNRKR